MSELTGPTTYRSFNAYGVNGIQANGKTLTASEINNLTGEDARIVSELLNKPNAAGTSKVKIDTVNKAISKAIVDKPKEELQPLEDNGAWIKTPIGGFSLGKPFKNISEQISYESQDLLLHGDANSKKGMSDYLAALENENEGSSLYYADTDSSIGGNDAMNPLWQYNIDDDIIWPHLKVEKDRGMGRVYAETYNKNQHILWLSFGIPKFAPLERFYKEAGAASSMLANILMDKNHSAAMKIGSIVGAGAVLAVTLPIWPLVGMIKTVEWGMDKLTGIHVNKYYEMVPNMPAYYKAVITILSHLLIGMNLTPNGIKNSKEKDVPSVDKNLVDIMEANLPDILKKGPDILYILSKRKIWQGHKRFTESEMDAIVGDYIDENRDKPIVDTADPYKYENMNDEDKKKYGISTKPKKGKGISSLFDILNDAALHEYQYIGFRIERGTDMSESVSNSTGEPSIAGKLNSASSDARDKRFSMSDGNLGDSMIGQLATGVLKAVEAGARVIGNVTGAGDAIQLISKGSGYFDIPDVWKDSSFNKSYNFDIKLHARYGDPLSIYQSVYIPLAMLIAGAFPIGMGGNTYTSPFLCQAFSKGLFSIPTGIIESMTIKRGLAEHGWTHDHLPTAIDISLSIKDLSPAMYISIANADANVFKFFKSDDSMKTYLGTLAGLDIVQMTHKLAKLNRRRKAVAMINRATYLNPKYLAISAVNNKLVRAATALRPPSAFKPRRT